MMNFKNIYNTVFCIKHSYMCTSIYNGSTKLLCDIKCLIDETRNAVRKIVLQKIYRTEY